MLTKLRAILTALLSLNRVSNRELLHNLRQTMRQNTHIKRSMHVLSVSCGHMRQRLQDNERELDASRIELDRLRRQVKGLRGSRSNDSKTVSDAFSFIDQTQPTVKIID